MSRIDLSKIATGAPTPCSIALIDLVRVMEKIDGLYASTRGRWPSDDEERLISQLEARRTGLEEQIRREVSARLGVDYGILWQAVTG